MQESAISSNNVLIRTERGWAGHFIGATNCKFRRNTLLSYNGVSIVISTVGLWTIDGRYEMIGYNRYFETMAFYSDPTDTRYQDPDVTKPICFNSDWTINEIDADDKANEMHENVVKEITNKLLTREIPLTTIYNCH